MDNFNEQLSEIAEDLEASLPNGDDDPGIWMKKAKDFVRLCLDGKNLTAKLIFTVPLQKQGELLRSVRVIESAGRTYQSALKPGIRSSIALILDTLGFAARNKNPTPFTIANLRDHVGALDPTQKHLLDTIWNHFVQTGNPYPFRSIPLIIGKQRVEDLYQGLEACLVETSIEGSRAIQITIYGAFQTGYGPILAARFVQLLEFIKALYEQDPHIKNVDRTMVKQGLDLADSDCNFLFALLKVNPLARLPFYRSSHNDRSKDWTITVTDEVVDLFHCDDVSGYFDGLLSTDYTRQQQQHNNTRIPLSTLNYENIISTTTSNIPSYVHEERIAGLRSLKNPQFDCIRLIRLCEELNSCAAGNNAHAVIMLTRAILDHVPPVFGYDNFSQVAANYKPNGPSFKKSVERLEKHSRNVADRYLHSKIRNKESVPTMNEVSFISEIDSVLSEVIRLLK